jgi:thioredoxin-related protein
METFLLNNNASYVLAKLVPYLLMIVIGFFIAWKWTRRYKWTLLKGWSVALLLLAAPFAIYFGVNPIYEGDFSNKELKIKVLNSHTTSLNNGLLVLAKPGCPYCFEAIKDLKLLKKRNPKMKIHFLVVNGQKADLLFYQSEAGKSIEVKSYNNLALFANEVGAAFPTFLVVNNKVATQYWLNNDFGAPAKDMVEALLKSKS